MKKNYSTKCLKHVDNVNDWFHFPFINLHFNCKKAKLNKVLKLDI